MRQARRRLIRLIYLAVVLALAVALWFAIPADVKRVVWETYFSSGS